MKIHYIKNTAERPALMPRIYQLKALEPLLLFVLLLLTWCFAPHFTQGDNPTLGMVDQGMWVLLILALIAFLMICAISWWLLKYFWILLGLPSLEQMVLQFNRLEAWQQLSFFLVSFVSLLLAAMGCVVAIC
jgi:hypothetical protein